MQPRPETSPESAVQREAAQRVGTTLLGKWRIDALLGVGGMAAVYAATHRNGARGAVKMLHRDQSDDEDIRSRFLREGYIANTVDHPGAVRVLDDDVAEDGSAFVVMELLSGKSLSDRAASAGGKLSLEEVLLVADQLLDVLAAAHDKGIVHRDVKPENVFLCDDGRVKILDFGIARLSTQKAEAMATALSTTQAGIPMGTPAFMSPEQARGRWDLVSSQSDIWSVGATLFTLLSGQLVHQEQTVSEVLAATFLKPARSLADAVPGAPRLVVELVDGALGLAPEQRWAGARAMQVALRKAYRRTVGVPMPAARPSLIVHAGEPRRSSMQGVETTAFPLITPRRKLLPPGYVVAAMGFAVGLAASVVLSLGLRAAPASGSTATLSARSPLGAGEAFAPSRQADPAAHLTKALPDVPRKASFDRDSAPAPPPPPPVYRPTPLPPARAIATTLDDPPGWWRHPRIPPRGLLAHNGITPRKH